MKRFFFLMLLLMPTVCLGESGSGIHHPPLEVNNNGSISYGWFWLLTLASGVTFSNNGDGTLSISCGGGGTTFLLLEDGTDILLEDGSKILTE